MTRHIAVAAFALLAFMPFAHAQTASEASVAHAGSIATACIGQWESQPCLAALAEANMTLAANYGASLEDGGDKAAAEQIKQHCAASTAARTEQVPGYAMQSAMTECANAISDISAKTNTLPDQSIYQLMTVGVWCLGKDQRCAASEEQLKNYAQ